MQPWECVLENEQVKMDLRNRLKTPGEPERFRFFGQIRRMIWCRAGGSVPKNSRTMPGKDAAFGPAGVFRRFLILLCQIKYYSNILCRSLTPGFSRGQKESEKIGALAPDLTSIWAKAPQISSFPVPRLKPGVFENI